MQILDKVEGPALQLRLDDVSHRDGEHADQVISVVGVVVPHRENEGGVVRQT